MTSPKLTGEQQRRFWKGNPAPYHGAQHADLLIFLTREFFGRRVLDAGAGDGSLVRALRSEFPASTVRGVDMAPKSEDVEEGDLTALDVPDGAFDTVSCVEVIEHLEPEVTGAVLAELYRVLAPGGHLVVTTPYDEELEKALVTCPHCESRFHRWGHQQRFVEADFARLAREQGFEPVALFPVKYSRVRRFRWLGPAFFRSGWMARRTARSKGGRNLVLVARRPA